MTSLTGKLINNPGWLKAVPKWFVYAAGLLFLVVFTFSLLAPTGGGISPHAKVMATKAQISTFSTSIDMFQTENGHYPKTLNELVVQPADAAGWHEYMEQIPLDPWGHAYIYTYPGAHQTVPYDLMSMGPDGKAGGDDDIVNWTTKK